MRAKKVEACFIVRIVRNREKLEITFQDVRTRQTSELYSWEELRQLLESIHARISNI